MSLNTVMIESEFKEIVKAILCNNHMNLNKLVTILGV